MRGLIAFANRASLRFKPSSLTLTVIIMEAKVIQDVLQCNRKEKIVLERALISVLGHLPVRDGDDLNQLLCGEGLALTDRYVFLYNVFEALQGIGIQK